MLKPILPALLLCSAIAAGCVTGPRQGQGGRAAGPAVAASDSGVVLTLRNGTEVWLRQDTTPGERWRSYSGQGFLEPLGAYLIHVAFYEGSASMLIHYVTGDTTWLPGAPVLSPSGDRFVATSVDLIAEYNPNVLQIYRVRPTGFEKEFELSPVDWGPSDARWVAEDTISFMQNVVSESWDYEQRPARVVRATGRWRVVLQRPMNR
ncbi:MAG TPA: hypothetical protein VMM12_18230 [Longimicrobiales bacterium]|nr:hypothetical protein [Longimicrobiales bacterium]